MSERRQKILVINPNSNGQVTQGISQALDLYRSSNGPDIDCETLAEGPFGIETQLHIDGVAEPLRRLVESHETADAFVIACYSDPGLQECRKVTQRPVYGIHESAVLRASAGGSRFGVIALSEASIKRHLVYLEQMNMLKHLAAERAAGLSVAEAAGGDETFDRLAEVGAALRDKDGANVIILGCTGMAGHREPLEEMLGVSVIDPTQAAVSMALEEFTGHEARAM
jgi:Asp/Glu/hydantoin racemase